MQFENVVCKMLAILSQPQCVNSLGPSDATWWQRSGSPSAQIMACCLMAPSHYLNQFWLIISKVEWHHLRASSQEIRQPSITEIICKIKYLKFNSNFPGANELRIWLGWHHALWDQWTKGDEVQEDQEACRTEWFHVWSCPGVSLIP